MFQRKAWRRSITPVDALRDLISEASDGTVDDLELWRERVRGAIGALRGSVDHPDVERFESKMTVSVVRSDATVRSGEFALAQRNAILAARSFLMALVATEDLTSLASSRVEDRSPEIDADEALKGPGDRRSVFLVHGRDEANVAAMKTLLRSLGLRVVDWEEAVSETGQPNPYIGDVVDVGLSLADAVLVLFTPDDLVRLRPDLLKPTDGEDERSDRGQPRPNVFYEAGMTQAKAPERSLMVSIGHVKVFSDISGRHLPRFDGSEKARHLLARRLKLTGLDIDDHGTDWLEAGEFVLPPETDDGDGEMGDGREPPPDGDGDDSSGDSGQARTIEEGDVDSDVLEDAASATDWDEESPGYVELLADMEEVLPVYAGTVDEVNQSTNAMTEIVASVASRIKESDRQGKGMKGRLSVAIQLAEELEPHVERIEELALEQDQMIERVGGGIEWILGHAAQQDQTTDSRELLESMAAMGESSQNAYKAVEKARSTLEPLGTTARPVRRVARRLDRSLELVAENFSQYASWGERARSLLTSE